VTEDCRLRTDDWCTGTGLRERGDAETLEFTGIAA
jgi:hypothetical protein